MMMPTAEITALMHSVITPVAKQWRAAEAFRVIATPALRAVNPRFTPIVPTLQLPDFPTTFMAPALPI